MYKLQILYDKKQKEVEKSIENLESALQYVEENDDKNKEEIKCLLIQAKLMN